MTLGLVLPGGGARGAYQVGAIKALSELMPSAHNPFPVIAGASVGAISASFLAANAARFDYGVSKLVDLWQNLHCHDIYRTDFVSVSLTGLHWVLSLTPFASLGLPAPRALLDNAPLSQFLTDHTEFSRIADAINVGALKAVCVTASSYDRGQAVTFFQGEPGNQRMKSLAPHRCGNALGARTFARVIGVAIRFSGAADRTRTLW